MSKERIAMRKIREVLRLKYENKISRNKIAVICKTSRSTVQDYIRRFEISGMSWPLSYEITDHILEHKLFPVKPALSNSRLHLDYTYLIQELKKPNVTMEVLWSEYKQAHPEGYQYSYFCELLTAYRKRLNYSMRQSHKGGEKGFLDFGKGLNLLNPQTGELISTQLFVFTWGASNYTFAKAVLSEDLPSWIKVNTEALEYFGCCPKVEVPDNLKSAVNKACRYEPVLNPTYAEFSAHYGMVIMPARPYKPKDKSKAENGVKLCKRWILARLRNRIFTNLHEMNLAIMELLDQFNNRIMKKIGKSRKELYEILDRPQALPLPDTRYVFADWKRARVNINYHISFDQHDYSVPYTFIHQEVEIRATSTTIEVYQGSQRICSHRRSYQKHGYTTIPEHMPPSHRKFLEWTPERIMTWAAKLGPQVKTLVEQIMQKRKHPEQAYKSCLGIIRLQKHFPAARLKAACQRALDFRVHTYQGVKSILAKQLDKMPSEQMLKRDLFVHDNVRGADYFSQTVFSLKSVTH